jgi:DNA-directed RNA polymerase beta' subunit
MRETVIRGIKGINSTEVINVIKSIVKDDGSVTTKVTYGISAAGTNTEEILNNDYVDRYKSQTDSIIEFEQTFGIEAARNKIIVELRKEMPDVSVPHSSIYADEMTNCSHVTSIHRTGLQKREMSNVTLRLSFQSPIQVIQNAAEDGLIDKIGGISGPLILGRTFDVGSTYNKVLINENFLKTYGQKLSKQIDDEL